MIKKLKPTFVGRGEVKGFVFNQIDRTDKFAIYEVDTGLSKHYEVFRIYKISYGNEELERETYPGSNSFGLYGWCYNSLKPALNKYKTLTINNL